MFENRVLRSVLAAKREGGTRGWRELILMSFIIRTINKYY
jgi:hypothetical protein